MFKRIFTELCITVVVCFGERVLERIMFPGLHRTAGRMAAADPTRADDILTLVAETLGLVAIVWLFNGTLYAIGYLTRRPLKPQVPMVVTVVISVLTFAGAYGEWAMLPTVPPPASPAAATH
jgi:hypothetical protein